MSPLGPLHVPRETPPSGLSLGERGGRTKSWGDPPRLGRALPWQAVRVLALDVPPAPDEAWARDALARLAFTPTVSPPDREHLANLLNMRAANL